MHNVTLKVTVQGDALAVDQAGNGHHIAHGESATITWQLKGFAAGHGTFNAIDRQGKPGFSWAQSMPSGVFSQAQLAHDGKEITLVDNNTDPDGINSAGDWIYQLCATIDGVTYSTRTSL